MPLSLVDAALRGGIVALLLLLLLLLPRGLPNTARRAPAAPAVVAARCLCAGLVVQVLSSLPWVEQTLPCAWQAPLVGVSVGNAVLFWLFVASLFDDDFRWRPLHALAWAGAVAMGAVQCLAAGGTPPFAAAAPALRLMLRLIPALGAGAAVWAALRHWRADLIESRRALRLWVLAGGGAYTVVQLAARLGSEGGQLSPALALLDMLALALLIGGVALLVLQVSASDWWAPAGAAAAEVAETVGTAGTAETVARETEDSVALDEPAAAALQRAMSEERLYRAEQLTVASLATHLGVPEYRLRRHINGQLGFRNFNTFVNSFRLADAKRWLADPAMRETPILTLALDAGFQSIGPFNRAFKADTGLTPSEFRQQQLADS